MRHHSFKLSKRQRTNRKPRGIKQIGFKLRADAGEDAREAYAKTKRGKR